MSWMWLFLAILFEVAATVCMKLSDGFTRRLPTVVMAILYLLSFIPMTWAIRRLEVSIAYAVWSAVGTALISIIGVYLFKEVFTMSKVIALVLIVAGVVVLNLSDRAVNDETVASAEFRHVPQQTVDASRTSSADDPVIVRASSRTQQQ